MKAFLHWISAVWRGGKSILLPLRARGKHPPTWRKLNSCRERPAFWKSLTVSCFNHAPPPSTAPPPKRHCHGHSCHRCTCPASDILCSTLPTAPSAEKVIVILRDGRKFIGILRSFDQFGALCCAACFWEPGLPGRSFVARFNSVCQPPDTLLVLVSRAIRFSTSGALLSTANLVLAETVERQVVTNMFSDTPLGIFVIRGDNVVVMGDVVRRYLYKPARIAFCLFATVCLRIGQCNSQHVPLRNRTMIRRRRR